MAPSAARQTQGLANLLGGSRTFRGRMREPRDLEEAIRRGLPISAFESFRQALEWTAAGRASRLARGVGPGFPGEGPVVAAAGKPRSRRSRPLTLLDTEIGTRRAEELLQRIEHGIHS